METVCPGIPQWKHTIAVLRMARDEVCRGLDEDAGAGDLDLKALSTRVMLSRTLV